MEKNVHRRDFLKLSLAAAAAPLGIEALAAEKPPTLGLSGGNYSGGTVPFHVGFLRVPARRTTLHVAVPLPESLNELCAALSELHRKLEPADLKAIEGWRAAGWTLFDDDTKESPITAQLVPATAADGTAEEKSKTLIASIPPGGDGQEQRQFMVMAGPVKLPADKSFRLDAIDNKSLKLLDGDQPVLVYNHGTITNDKVPENNPLRSRACYVHPLWGLNGEVLTDDFPKDHYHHHGVFWTWPHVGIDGKEHNLWAGDTIHDRFVRWIAREAGPAAAVLAVENGWFVGEKKVMIERVWMRVYKAAGDARAIDFDFTWIPVDKPITLWGAEGKSYGGLTVRFAPGPRAETLITVPSGPTKEDLPDTKLEWADFTSKFAGAKGRSGAAIFVHPSHPDYPPTWLTRYYGAMCVGWPGVKPKTFEPGKPIRLSYRIWVHKGPADVAQLKRAYGEYGEKKKVEWE